MTTRIKKTDAVSQVEGLISSNMDGEMVILSVGSGKYYNFGEIGGEIWNLIKEPIRIQDLITSLVANFDVEESVCETQVISFLSQLLAENVIQSHTTVLQD